MREDLYLHFVDVAEQEYEVAVRENGLTCPRDMYVAAAVRHQIDLWERFKEGEEIRTMRRFIKPLSSCED